MIAIPHRTSNQSVKACQAVLSSRKPRNRNRSKLAAGLKTTEWENTDAGRHILIDVTRYLATHSPTERAALQTADIARRLMRGGELHQEEGASS
jgi:hypothetical protein